MPDNTDEMIAQLRGKRKRIVEANAAGGLDPRSRRGSKGSDGFLDSLRRRVFGSTGINDR